MFFVIVNCNCVCGSGMLVQDPSKINADVEAIFEQARQMGAGQGSTDYQPASDSRSFTGTGRLLSGESVQIAPQPPESVLHDVIFWADGFTVDDGPLRRFDDPSNEDFLEVYLMNIFFVFCLEFHALFCCNLS